MCLFTVLVLFMPVSEQLAGPSKATSKEGNFLIPTEPLRGGPTPVTKANAAAHLLTHFGLQVCNALALSVDGDLVSSPALMWGVYHLLSFCT